MMDTYQVWHKDGEAFSKVADVQAMDAMEAVIITLNEEIEDDGGWRVEQRWYDHPAVVFLADGERRSTTVGDIVIHPSGVELLVTDNGDHGFDFLATDAIRRQRVVERLEELEQAVSAVEVGWLENPPGWQLAETGPGEPEVTPAEREALFRSWRDDASQRPLMEKGVDYSDAPYAEASGDDYAGKLKAGMARAKYKQPETDSPQL